MTHFIKTSFAFLVIFIAAMPAFGGEKTVGLNAGFNSYNSSALAGVEFTYRFSSRLRIAPSVLYAFKHKQRDAMLINLNVHIPFSLPGVADLYPLAGLNYSSWNFHHLTTGHNDVATRDSRFGLNLGAGVGLRLRGNLRLGLEAYYTLIKHYGGVNAMAKISYAF